MTKRYIYNDRGTRYLVSPNGDIYSEITNKFIKHWKNKHGYEYVDLFINGKTIRKGVHCIVAETYIPNIFNKPQVNHIDGNKSNNKVSNLEWVTQSENSLHALKNGLRKAPSGEKVHFAKYTSDQVRKACEEMMKSIHSLKEIESITGIPSKTLSEIRSGKIWKDISKDFIFPPHVIASRIGISYENKCKIHQMLIDGISIKDICKELNLPDNKQVQKSIYDIRRNMDPKNKPIRKRDL